MKTDDILAAARHKLGVTELTQMQRDVAEVTAPSLVLVAPTGSGKTLAFALAALQRAGLPGRGHVEICVVAPTRELVMQIARVMSALAPAMKVTPLYGGHSMLDECRSVEGGCPDVVVATPGRLIDHLQRRTLSLDRVATLVLDEYDKALELGFHTEMRRVVRAMQGVRFTVLTSATAPEALPDFLTLRQPVVTIDYSPAASASGHAPVAITRVESPVADKLDTLAQLLSVLPHERTLVFVNHRESVARVTDFLVKKRFPAGAYHGAMTQQEREMAIDLFTNGTLPIMVATDLAARGLDIAGVESVVHYHLPSQPEVWTHRNGRTARMGAGGSVYAITAPGEECACPDASVTVMTLQAAHTVEPWRRTVLSLYFHAGRREKLSKGDVLGALVNEAHLTPGQVGAISVHDHHIIAAVDAQMAATAVAVFRQGRIKGRRIRVTLV